MALTSFGVDSGIELFTALVVLRQLLLHTERATDEELDAPERQAATSQRGRVALCTSSTALK